MNTESDTPRTDALMPDQVHKRTMYEHILVIEAHARQLERELNEVTKQRDGLHELHNKNAARSAEILELCQTMRQQRNALTEALIAAQGALNPLSGFTKIKGNRYLEIVRDKVREALETTKGEKP